MSCNKKNGLIGLVSLLVSAVLQAAFLCYLQNDWIVLAFICICAIMFLKYLKNESSVKWLIVRLSKKKLRVTGTIILIVGLVFLPQALGQYREGATEFIVYVMTYICWMVGLLLIDISKGLSSATFLN